MVVTKQVILKISGEEYGVDIAKVTAIEKYHDIRSIPNAPAYIEGVINLRGEIIPVYSLRMKFKLPPAGVDINTKVIVTKANDMSIAFQVDSVNEIIELENEDVTEPPAICLSSETNYIDRFANINGRMVILLKLDGILTEEEQRMIKELLEERKK